MVDGSCGLLCGIVTIFRGRSLVFPEFLLNACWLFGAACNSGSLAVIASYYFRVSSASVDCYYESWVYMP